MALTRGTNCGFVSSAPVANPNTADELNFDDFALAFKDVSPVGTNKIVEIGWWCDNATQEANYEVGIYTHNAGDDEPEAVVGAISTTNAKGTDAGWKIVTGLDITISAETTYFLAVQLDDTATTTNTDEQTSGGSPNDTQRKTSQSSLPDPWGTTDLNRTKLMGIYAVYEEDVQDVTFEATTLTLSTTELEPTINILVPGGALGITSSLLAPVVDIEVIKKKLSGSFGMDPSREEEKRKRFHPVILSDREKRFASEQLRIHNRGEI